MIAKKRTKTRLRNAFHTLLKEFLEHPYRYLNEADAVARFYYHLIKENPTYKTVYETKDEQNIGLIHIEYPSFSKIQKENEKKQSKKKRGRYDLALLKPDFIKKNEASTIVNNKSDNNWCKNIKPKNMRPIKAVVEFKLGKSTGYFHESNLVTAMQPLGKLVKLWEEEEFDMGFFIFLLRYPEEKKTLEKSLVKCEIKQKIDSGKADVRFILAVSWQNNETDKDCVYYYCGQGKEMYFGKNIRNNYEVKNIESIEVEPQ